MHAKSTSRSNVSFLALFVVVAFFALAFFAVVYAMGHPGTISEGVEIKPNAVRHFYSMAILNCPSGNLGLTMYNSKTGRTAKLCEFLPDQWGEMVQEENECRIETMHACADRDDPTKNTLEHQIRKLNRQGYEVTDVRPDLSQPVYDILKALTGGK
jgi:hypothetical protein